MIVPLVAARLLSDMSRRSISASVVRPVANAPTIPRLAVRAAFPTTFAAPPSGFRTMPHTVLLTGATGFVGSHVAEALARRGDSVRTLARAGSDTAFIEPLGV